MSFLGGIAHKIRNGFDDVGSFVTGDPVHNVVPPVPIAAQPWHAPMALPQKPQIQPGSLPAFGHSIVGGVSNTLNQINPFDNGRTWQNTNGNLQQKSVLHQATHNGLTNVAGDFAKPVIRTGIAVNQGIGNAELKIAGRPTQNADQFVRNSFPSAPNANKAIEYTGTKRQILGDVANTALTATAPGLGKVIDRSFESVAPKIIPRIVTRTVANAGTGAIIGAPLGVTSYISSNQPLSLRGVGQSALQGAKSGAVLGGASTVAPVAARAVSDQLHKLPDTIRTSGLKAASRNSKVQNIGLKKLTSYEGAPDARRVAYYKQQIKQGKPIEPLIAMRDSEGNLGIEDGKHRYQAYKELGISNVPTRIVTPEQVRAISEGGYARIPGGADGEIVPPPQTSGLNKATSNSNDGAGLEPVGQTAARRSSTNDIPNANQSKGFIVKESKPLPDGSKIVIRASKDPATGKLVRFEERVDKNSNKPLNAESYSNVFDVPLKQAQKELSDPTAKLGERPEVSPLDLDTNKQMGMKTTTKALKAAENTEKNPLKVNIPEVDVGDYAKARSNAQLASAPVDLATKQAMQAIKRLTPEEKANFWKAVEEPKGLSKNMQEAVRRWNDLSNRVHAASQALGGNTTYLKNYARHEWDLSKPEDAARFAEIVKERGTRTVDPFDFAGLDRQPRVFRSISEGEQAGFHLKGDDPTETVRNYGSASAHALKQQALAKGFTEADMGADKSRVFDLGGLKNIPLSEQGYKEMGAYEQYRPSQNKAIKTLRTVNQGAKSSILSLGQFHTINIGALRAAPTLIAEGHPVAAARGLYGMLRGAFGNHYAEQVIGRALKDGTVDKAARIGMPYGGSGYDMSGTFLKKGLGSDLVFGKQIPMMHDQVVRSIISDLEKTGVNLDSTAAREAGLAGANLMGELNRELLNISPRVQKAMSDWMLAGQFTPSKFLQLGRAVSKGGIGGSYARTNIAANVAASAAVIIALGYAAKQKSDNIRDLLIRAIVDPSVPTPWKDQKGNTIRLKLPGTDTSDISKLMGIKAVRNSDGHLGISWNIHNVPSTVADFARARLSPLASTVLKDVTNTNYAGKPVYDPNAEAGKKAIQIATSNITGNLPISLQGIPMTSPVESKLPGSSQEILDAQKPGTNPLGKSIISSFGLTPASDPTVGKGLDSSRYYDAKDKFDRGFNSQEQNAFNIITGSKKNPVTGKYDVMPSVFDSPAKAELLLQNPKVLDAVTSMNKRLAEQGQKVDPFYTSLTSDQQKAYLAYQTVDKNNTAQISDWQQKNPWSTQFNKDRAIFYNSLPPGDPNRPKDPIPYPTESANVSQAFEEYDSINDPIKRGEYFGQHPELSAYMDQMTDYTNQLLTAQGLTPLKPYPKTDSATESYMNTYMNADKSTRTALRTGNPQGYTNMQAYLQNIDEYEVAKNGALDQLQGQTPNQKLLKGISSLANYDMVTNPDGSLALKYGTIGDGATTYGSVSALPQSGATGSGGYGGSGGSSYAKRQAKYRRPLRTPKSYKKFVKAKKPHKHFFYTRTASSSKTFKVAKASVKSS
jgi:hypothetical protein